MAAKLGGGNNQAPAAARAIAAPSRPRDEVLDDIAHRLDGLETAIGELRSPAAEEVMVDFVNLIRCRLRPLREGTEKPERTKMGGYKPFTDDEPNETTDDAQADDAAADDAEDVGS